MAVVRWEPFREIESLQQEMNRLFETLAPRRGDGMMGTGFMPPAEMSETEEAVHLKVEIPGMKPENLDIQVAREAVIIRGERKEEMQSEEKGMKRSEFRYGQFSRTISLPSQVDNSNVQAEYKDGILLLTMPKAEEDKKKVVKVNVAS
ncbi:MAG: Hsp20/alpha crystallin family protein [Chloroflexaceae bacterium]|nr:Hsp20/alpha crystallin family protein [Chloroflexaceae bacterium]